MPNLYKKGTVTLIMGDLLEVARAVADHYRLDLQQNPHFADGGEQLEGSNGLCHLLLTTEGHAQTLRFDHRFAPDDLRESVSISNPHGSEVYGLDYRTEDLGKSTEKFKPFAARSGDDLGTRFARELGQVLPTITRPADAYRLSFSLRREELSQVPALLLNYISAERTPA